ncbi:MAG: SMC-Scp complex subunit ScpB [Pirellulaceae bacterium]|nr:SMC-Scp complex subunit ScpB [Pirellulaceae bacterium]
MSISSRSTGYAGGKRTLEPTNLLRLQGFSARSFQSGSALQRSWFFQPITSERPNSDPGLHEKTSGAIGKKEDAQTENKRHAARRRLEAVLLVSREPVSPRKLVQLADLADATQVRTLSRQLNEVYDAGGHAFRIEEVAGGYVMLTRPQFARWLRKLDGVKPEEHLSQSAMETLAIVAYRQPVLRADIEAIRGVGCDEVLRQLMQRDLVRISGRSEDLGRPYLYGTTKRFLQLFGLRSLDRLPRSDWVRQAEVHFEPQATDNTQLRATFSSEV